MSSECEALRQELARIRQEIAALDSRYIPQSQRPVIDGAITRAQNTADAAKAKADQNFAAIGLLIIQVTSLQALVFANTVALTALSALVAGLQAAITALRAVVSSLATRSQLEALRRQVESNSSGIDRLFGLVNTLSGRIQRNTERITALETFVRAAIASLQSEIAGIASQISQVRAIANNALSEAASAKSEAARAHRRIDDLLGRLLGIERRITSLAVRISTLEDVIRALEQKVVKNARDISDLRLKLNILNGLLAALDVLVAGALVTLAQLVARVGQIAATLAGFLAQVTRALDLAQRAIALGERAIAAVERFNSELQQIRQFVERLAQQLRDLLDGEGNEMLDELLEEVLQIVTRNQELLQGEATGELTLALCPVDGEELEPEVIQMTGEGLSGIYSTLNALTVGIETLNENTKCPSESTAALPMFWEIKAGVVPQLVVIWQKLAGGQSTWSMTIPHPRESIDKDYPFNFPSYRKGGNMASVRLVDNSQIIINAFSEPEAQRVIDYISTLLDPTFIPSGGLKMVYSQGVAEYAEVEVKASYVKRFEGHKTTAPLWGRRISD